MPTATAAAKARDLWAVDVAFTASELVGAVHDLDATRVAELLTRPDTACHCDHPRYRYLEAIATALAAMVPDDRTTAELLAWLNDEDPASRQPAPRPVVDVPALAEVLR